MGLRKIKMLEPRIINSSYKKIIYLIIIILVNSLSLLAQNGTVASAGKASGNGGYVTYSIGQVNYISVSGNNGKVAQGLQQSYEIMTIQDGAKTSTITLYPNPTTDYIVLNIQNTDLKSMSYSLFDAPGRVIKNEKLFEAQTEISMLSLANGTYFIKVMATADDIKTFKIIKVSK